jgi:hypothetical protein
LLTPKPTPDGMANDRTENLTMLDTPKPDTQIDLEEYLADLEEHLADLEEQANRNDHDRAQEGNQ